MEGVPAVYLGRAVDKENFRAFVYGAKGEKKLVESWDEFEASMQSGLWFATIEDAVEVKAVEVAAVEELPKAKPKAKSRVRPRPLAKNEPVVEDEDSEDILPDDGSVFEVEEDFLPNEKK